MGGSWIAVILAILAVASLSIAWSALRRGVINAGGISFERARQPIRYWTYLMLFPLLAAMLCLNAYDFVF
jgi:hypothetical protein